MSVRVDVVCRLCLKEPFNNFVLIDETTRQGLDVLGMKMNVGVSNDPLMCDDCTENMNRSLSFILMCLNSENSLLWSGTGEEKINIDLRKVYASNSKYADSIICRFCIKQVEGTNCVPLNDIKKKNPYLDMFKEYFFKMDENVIKNPLVCSHCIDTIENCIKFLLRFFETEQKIDMYRQIEGILGSEKIELSNVSRFSKYTLEYPEIRTQVCEVKKEESSIIQDVAETEITDVQEHVKEELVSEDEEANNCYQNTSNIDHILCICDTKDGICLGSREASVQPASDCLKMDAVFLVTNGAFIIQSETSSEGTHPQSSASERGLCICNKRKKNCSKCSFTFEVVSTAPTVYKCKLCPYQGIGIKSHILKHGEISEEKIYRCTACDFKSNYKANLKSHLSTHKPEAELKMYKCTACDYKTKRTTDLRRHSLTHNTDAELSLYKCNVCDYKTNHKTCFNRHSLTHVPKNNPKSDLLTYKSEAGLTMYKCAECDFETKHKNCIKRHSRTHRTTYKCAACDYKTKHKQNLKNHSLIHITKDEITYRCTICEFKTIQKSALKKHLVIHKTEAELTMYQCETCDFKTKYKSSIQSHLLTHKTKAELFMYKCTICDYKTIHKNNLRSHQLHVHEPKGKPKLYKCTVCGYKTVRKNDLENHSLTHKNSGGVTVYKCSSCDFNAIHKDSLKRHSVIHKTEAELTMYKCTACDFKTKYKNYLNTHSRTHKTEAEIKMYQCTICDFKSKYKSSVTKHLSIHESKAEITDE